MVGSSRVPRIVLWPRVVSRWHIGSNWCVASRVLSTISLLRPIVDPNVMRRDPESEGVVLVFDTPTSAFLEDVAPELVRASIPFAVSIATAHVRMRAPRRARTATAITWSELEDLVGLGVTVAVRGHDVDDLAVLPDELAFGQLAHARGTVRRFLGIEPWLVCDPTTSSRLPIARIARELGFEAGVVRLNGTNSANDPLRRPALVPRPWQSAHAIARRVRSDAASGTGR